MQELERDLAYGEIPSLWPDLLLNGSEMGKRVRDFPWERTSVGSIHGWPQSLRGFVSMIVENDFPMFLYWGSDHVAIYNDAYAALAGDRHPKMLGTPGMRAWGNLWPRIGPAIGRAHRGERVTFEDYRRTIERDGSPEDIFLSFCYSPLRASDGHVAGVLATIADTTQRVLAQRRLELLRRLVGESAARTQAEALERFGAVLAESADLRFALVYLAPSASAPATLASRVGAVPPVAIPESIELHDVGTDVTAWCEASATLADLLSVPIHGSDQRRPLGALVVAKAGRLRIDDAYREFVHSIARRIGTSIVAAREWVDGHDRAELLDVSRTIEKIRLFAESSRPLFWTCGPDGSVDWVDRSWADYTGLTLEETKGFGWRAVHHPDDADDIARLWSGMSAEGKPFESTLRLRGKDGRYRWFSVRGVPERDDDGRIVRWYGTSSNVDAERRAARQLAFFASLGDRLGRTLERHDALRALAEGLVPDIADWTLINLADATGRLVLAHVQHRDAEKTRLLEPFLGRTYVEREATSVSARVFKSGEAVVAERAEPVAFRGRIANDFVSVIERLGLTSYVVVPIVADGLTFGTFHVASASDKAYAEDDVPFFSEIGRRMGFALQNVDTYERESKIASAFQGAALPTTLPKVPGLSFSSICEPASREAMVGGDFYDAFRLLDGRVVVSIGDVAGAGVAAVATMAALRQSIRAIANVSPDPKLILRAADAVFSEADRPAFASAFVAVVDPLTLSVRYANAGHPAPILRAPGGSTRKLGSNDLLLGLDFGTSEDRNVGALVAEPGSLLVLYTDGLTEANRDVLDGEARVERAVDLVPEESGLPADAARAFRDATIGQHEGSHDDTTVLMVLFERRLSESAGDRVVSWRFACEDGRAARLVRDELASRLHAFGLDESETVAAEMIFSELVGNVLRHSGGEVEVALDLTQEAAVLHVLDSGEGFSLNPRLPADAYAERGRGLFIAMQVAREFSVAPRTGRPGSHARAVVCGRARRA